MSAKTLAIIEQLKSLTLLEIAELIKQIEETFAVDTSSAEISSETTINQTNLKFSELSQTTLFDVVLEKAPTNTKSAIIKVVWNITDLGLKRARDLVNSAPTVIKQAVTSDLALKAKTQLEAVGATVSLK